MSLVSSLRRRSRLTQHELARRAGTSRTRLSAYEHGHTDPGLETVTRLANAAGFELDLVPVGRERVRERVALIGQIVAHSERESVVRWVAELVTWVRTGVVSFAALNDDPGSTGTREWDALIGGVAELLAREAGHPVPGWAAAPGRCLPDPWFVTTLHSVRSGIVLDTPPPLAARGVFLSAASLASV